MILRDNILLKIGNKYNINIWKYHKIFGLLHQTLPISFQNNPSHFVQNVTDLCTGASWLNWNVNVLNQTFGLNISYLVHQLQ